MHAASFANALDSNCFAAKSASARYGNGRLLALLEMMAGPAAVMEINTTRKRWFDSAGAAAVDDPVQERLFFQSILARHGIAWKAFLLRYSGEIAHIFAYPGNGHRAPEGGGFPVEKAFFTRGPILPCAAGCQPAIKKTFRPQVKGNRPRKAMDQNRIFPGKAVRD